MNKLILIRGLPGSGKSTRAKQLLADGAVDAHFEADQFFTDSDGNYNFDQKKLHLAHSICFSQMQSAMALGLDVVVSNTFTTYKEIVEYFRFAELVNARVDIITMTENYGSIHNVPEEAMERMRNRWMPTEKIVDLFAWDE